MPASMNLRKQIEQLAKENAALQAEIQELTADVKSQPDFSDPSSVVEWYGRSIITLLGQARVTSCHFVLCDLRSTGC